MKWSMAWPLAHGREGLTTASTTHDLPAVPYKAMRGVIVHTSKRQMERSTEIPKLRNLRIYLRALDGRLFKLNKKWPYCFESKRMARDAEPPPQSTSFNGSGGLFDVEHCAIGCTRATFEGAKNMRRRQHRIISLRCTITLPYTPTTPLFVCKCVMLLFRIPPEPVCAICSFVQRGGRKREREVERRRGDRGKEGRTGETRKSCRANGILIGR